MRAVVVGAGVGGLCAAIRLAAVGHRVTVLERNDVVGGKLAGFTEAGFVADVGPTLLTLPGLFDDVFRLAGTSLAEQLDVVRLDPRIEHRWPDGASLVFPDGRADDAVESFSPGEGRRWRSFEDHAERIWRVAERTFLAGPMSPARVIAGMLRSPADVVRIDGARTLSRLAASTFRDPRLRHVVGRLATYSGSSPDRAPATLACIAHVEREFGCWHVVGGLARLAEALGSSAQRLGVDVRTGTDVVRVVVRDGRAVGVATADGTVVDADLVVSDVDAAHLWRDLLPDPPPRRDVEWSTSAVVVSVGVRRDPGRPDRAVVGHHTVFFSADVDAEFRALAAGSLPDDPTVHACVPTATDPSMAPPGCDVWTLLVNAPSGVTIDRSSATGLVLDRLAAHGVDLRRDAEFVRTRLPSDLADRYRAPGGAIYGTSSNGRRAAFVRPGNRGPVAGLYLVGGSAHPGGGLPMVATGARIATGLVAADTARADRR